MHCVWLFRWLKSRQKEPNNGLSGAHDSLADFSQHGRHHSVSFPTGVGLVHAFENVVAKTKLMDPTCNV